jgi:hypothetical protein
MKTELRREMNYEFSLTEQELRRIHETMVQQMKSNSKNNSKSFFELSFKNGVRAEKATLDEIIADNNSGEWKIQELKMKLVNKSHLQETRIEMEFRVPPDKDGNPRKLYSIQYLVAGNERDWVYLTSSQLDDRIAKIKQFPIYYISLLATSIGIVGLFLLVVGPPGITKFPLGYKVCGWVGSISLLICGLTSSYGFPLYNFCWGDYLKVYNDRRTLAKYVIGGVMLTLVLGIISSVVASLFFLK